MSIPSRSGAPGFWAPVAIIGGAQFLVVMNNAIINIALPSLVAELDISDANLSWVVTGYLLAFGSLLLLGGRIGDALGHRTVFIAGLAVTALAAGGAGLTDSGGWFIAWRALQGAAAALVSPAAVALLTTTFTDPRTRSRAFGIYGAVTGAGGGAGLILGGLLTDAFSWRAAMLVSVPVAIALLIGARFVLARDVRQQRGGFALPSVALGACAVGALLFAITRSGSRPELVAGALVLACCAAVGFVGVERRAADPLIPRSFFASRQRLLGLLTVGCGALGLTGVFVVLSTHMQHTLGMSATEASLAALPYACGMMLSAQLAPRLIARFGAARVAVLGTLLAAVCLVPLAWTGTGTVLVLAIPSLIAVSAAIGPAFVAGTQLALTGVGGSGSGVAGALLNSASEIGGAVGVAVLSAISLAPSVVGTQGASAFLPAGGFGLAIFAAATVLAGGALGGLRLSRQRG